MRIPLHIREWSCLSALLGLSLLNGCSKSDNTPAPQAAASPAASAPSSDLAPDPAQSAESEPASGDGYTPPGSEEPNSGDAGMGGMPNSGMAGMGGMPNSGMGGMPNSGMGGMPNSGMGGMPNSGMGEIGSAGMSPDYDGMSSMAGAESMGGPGMMRGMGMGGPGMMGGGMGMGGMGGPAFEDPAPPEDADYLTKAKYAFAIGKETAAEPYVIAEMLANESEAANLLQQIRFSMALRKPALTLRFGVGVNLTAPSTITDYKPIGRYASQNGQGGGGGGGESMGMMGGSGMPGGPQAGGAQKTLGDLTGNFGDEFIKSFEGVWDAGAFGSVFADVEPITPRNRTNPAGQNNRMMEMSSGMSGMSAGGMGMNFGAEGMPGAEAAAPAAGEALRLRATPGKPVVPGLTYLGTGKEAELLGKAETEGLDYLFLFEVEVEMKRQRQQQLVNNDTKLRLLVVKETSKDKRTLGSTSTLNNIKVDYDPKGDNEDVAKNLANLFRKVDAIKLQEMPKMKPELAQVRVKSLIEKKTKDVLPILMEIKLYHSQGLLNDEERDAAYQLTLPNGLAFASGTPEDRAFVLDPLLPGYK